jgi:hypothetical protein
MLRVVVGYLERFVQGIESLRLGIGPQAQVPFPSQPLGRRHARRQRFGHRDLGSAGINCGATCSASFDHGAVVTLTVSPATGSTFTGWSGGGCTGTGSCTTTVTAAVGVTATFTLQQFPLTFTFRSFGNGTGSVTSSPPASAAPVHALRPPTSTSAPPSR